MLSSYLIRKTNGCCCCCKKRQGALLISHSHAVEQETTPFDTIDVISFTIIKKDVKVDPEEEPLLDSRTPEQIRKFQDKCVPVLLCNHAVTTADVFASLTQLA